MPQISVIIPTYNRCSFVQKAVASVLAQSFEEFEVIVVDDGSTDATAETLKTIVDTRLRYWYQENRGAAAARNTGISLAKGPLIAFLDSDDRFEKKKLELQKNAMDERPDILISHTQEVWFRRGKFLNQKKKHRKEEGDLFKRCLELCAVGMSTTMVRRELFTAVGTFDETFPCCEDYEFWLRASVHYPFLLVDQPLTIKEGGRPDQLSVHYRVGIDRFRIRAIQQLLQRPDLTEEQRLFAAGELVKKCTIYGKGCLKHGKVAEGEEYLLLAQQTRQKERGR